MTTPMRELSAQFRELTDRPRLYEIVLTHGRAMEVPPLTLAEKKLLDALRAARGITSVIGVVPDFRSLKQA